MKIKRRYVMAACAVLVAACAVGGAVYKGGDYLKEKKESLDYAQQVSVYKGAKPRLSESPTYPTEAVAAVPDYLAEGRKVNSDIVAWLTIDDTGIDFPIVQTSDNSYYLSHDFEKQSSYMGAPYLDYRCEADFSGFNSIIYGHNISNKYMFYPLLNFQQSDYFDSHRSGRLTLAERVCQLEIIACAVVKNDDFAYNSVFLTDREREVFLETLAEKAVCKTNFDTESLSEGNLLTLSTCSYEFADARTVVVAVIE